MSSPLTTFTATTTVFSRIICHYFVKFYETSLKIRRNLFFGIWAIFSDPSSFSVRSPTVINVLNGLRITLIKIALLSLYFSNLCEFTCTSIPTTLIVLLKDESLNNILLFLNYVLWPLWLMRWQVPYQKLEFLCGVEKRSLPDFLQRYLVLNALFNYIKIEKAYTVIPSLFN